jgi:4-hydroxyphenylacetate 3-monooxygenase
MQHEPTLHPQLTYPSTTSGKPVGLSFLIPKTREDLFRRRQMSKIGADATCGGMGRSADFLNTMLTASSAHRVLRDAVKSDTVSLLIP